MKSWKNWLHGKGCYYDPPCVIMHHTVGIKVVLKQVTCSKLFTTFLSSLVVSDPHLQWFLKLTCEYPKSILSNLSNTTNMYFLSMWYLNMVCLYRCIFSPAWGGWGFFPHKRIMDLKLMITGSQKSHGIVLAARDYWVMGMFWPHTRFLRNAISSCRSTVTQNNGRGPESVPTESTYSRKNNKSVQIRVPWQSVMV